MKRFNLSLPVRTVLLYLVFGSLWILLSDQILFVVLPASREEVMYQTAKGWFFILASGLLLYAHLIRELNVRRQTENALHGSEERLAGIIDSAMDGIISIDPTQRIILVNPAAANMFGYKEVDLLGQPLDTLIPAMYREIHHQHVQRFGLTKTTKRSREKLGEILCLHANGMEFPVEASISNSENNGQKIHTVILRDISERKKAEEDLRALNDKLEQHVTERTEELHQTNKELERANRAKNEFLANMSHELRTPLNSILGLSESLLEQRRGPLNEKQAQALEWIGSSGHHLLSLINDILEVSKIEAGKLQIHPDIVSIKELCESSLNFIREAANKKSITLDLRYDASITALKADPQRIKQILINLLSNAVKFTPERGNVRLEVHANDQRDQVQFVVMDDGIGIAADDLPKLFTPFTQLDSSLSRQYAGSGLGLVLVFKFTEMHGGSVHVESAVGKGSRFTINLPVGFDTHNEKAGIDTTQASSNETRSMREEIGVMDASARKTILLAEDNETNVLTVSDYLESLGFSVIIAHDGIEAVEKAETVRPDVILMDVQMPVMDGLEAIGILRKNPRFAATPIIALTALAMPGDRERCLSAGADEYLSKPVSLKGLVKTIDNLLQHGDD